MKKTIFLHVGHPKTGSSSLQQFLAANRSVLEKYGYSYPACPSGRPNHHFLFLEAYSSNLKVRAKEGYKQSTVDRLILLNRLFYQSLKTVPTPNIILSHECLIYGLNKLLPYFMQDFNIVVIAYFRRIDHFVESFYGELTSHGSEHNTIEEHIQKNFKKLYFSRYNMIKCATELLGKNNIIIRPYERGQLKDQDVVHDFLSVLNIHDTVDFKFLSKERNPRVSSKLIHFNRLLSQAFYNRNYFAMSRKVNGKLKFLSQQKADNEKKDSLLSYDQRMALIEKTKLLDSEIARDYLKRDHEMLFYEALPKADLVASQAMLSTQEITELLADFLLLHPPMLDDFLSGDLVDRRYELLLEKSWQAEKDSQVIFEEVILE